MEIVIMIVFHYFCTIYLLRSVTYIEVNNLLHVYIEIR